MVAGSLCVALGLVGMFLPLLPTTPFLLLAAACYARASRRFYAALLASRTFGPVHSGQTFAKVARGDNSFRRHERRGKGDSRAVPYSRWHAARCPGASSRSAGTSSAQRASA